MLFLINEKEKSLKVKWGIGQTPAKRLNRIWRLIEDQENGF